jgi:UPF0755 protein
MDSIIKKYWKYITASCVLFVGIVIIIIGSIAPSEFPSGTIYSIRKNSGISRISDDLAKQGIIKSPFLFKVYATLLHGGKGVQAGDYLFKSPESVLRVAYRMAYGMQELPQIEIAIPEGLTVSNIGRLLAKNIPNFDVSKFLLLAKPDEGYLFPDTYYFYQNTATERMIEAMKSNFKKQTAIFNSYIAFSGKTKKDIITMASIVEKEATSTDNRKIIAGILWKRIEAGMPLQVDPPFFYTLGKTSAQLTSDDLKTDSPYNLYIHKGLPPTPIDNPGLDAITATVHPVSSKFWFYLSDAKGNMHYAETHDGHLANKAKYLQ